MGVCVLPEPVCVVTRQREGIVFRGKCQLGAIPPHLTRFLSWKRYGSISCRHTHKGVNFVFSMYTIKSNTPLQMHTCHTVVQKYLHEHVFKEVE